MVKFSRELEAHLIPEWKDAFVNYWQLKKNVKKIRLCKKAPQIEENNGFVFSILDPLRSIGLEIASKFSGGRENHDIIQVKRRGGEKEALYETDLVHLFSEGNEIKEFFEKLDDELNKVNHFYKTRESEFLERGRSLNKQLQILLELKQVLHERRRKKIQSGSDAGSLSCSNSSTRSFNYSEAEIEFDELPSDGSPTDDVIIGNFMESSRPKTKKGRPRASIMIDIPATTPIQAIATVTSMLWEDLMINPKKESRGESISRKKIQYAEKMIRGGFCGALQRTGIVKNLQVVNQQASRTYLKAVKRSHFISSNKVVGLADEVEAIFTKHFANNDRKKAMKYLRPQHHKESHMITFFVGLFTGCFFTLFSVYAILAHLSGMFSAISEAGYIETVYPVFSMFALLSLHIFLYGCNLFMWKSTRINYNFIFEFSPSTALKYRDVFLICTSFMTMVVGGMVIHLILRSSGFSPRHVDAIPGMLLMLFTGLLISPFNMFYRSSRYCFLRVMRNIICSPFYKVLMVDFFMADQLTSQIPLLRHMEFIACYFLAGNFNSNQYQTCTSSKQYKQLAYVISFMPYYWRAMQCARRWFDEKDLNHLANLGKYVSAMLAAGARLTYSMQPTPAWMGLVIATSSVATVYQLYWDFVKDWGLLNRKSKNPWLRDDLVLKHNSIYYFSIGLNFVLRLAWVQTVMHFNIGKIEYRLLDFLLASLEIFRRGHWNFYRLENEHLNNVGKFRAVKTVPLPFQEMDSDD